jgi:hypothetical protein
MRQPGKARHTTQGPEQSGPFGAWGMLEGQIAPAEGMAGLRSAGNGGLRLVSFEFSQPVGRPGDFRACGWSVHPLAIAKVIGPD